MLVCVLVCMLVCMLVCVLVCVSGQSFCIVSLCLQRCQVGGHVLQQRRGEGVHGGQQDCV